MTQYASFKYECDCACGCKRREGDIAIFLFEHEPEDKSYCFDCVEVRGFGKKNQPLIFKDGHNKFQIIK